MIGEAVPTTKKKTPVSKRRFFRIWNYREKELGARAAARQVMDLGGDEPDVIGLTEGGRNLEDVEDADRDEAEKT